MKMEVLQTKECNKVTINNPKVSIPLINKFYKNIDKAKYQEVFSLITLDSHLSVISMSIITIGTLSMSVVHPRDVFAKAISDHALGIILCHNHPGGNLTPSDSDIQFTERIFAGCEILGLRLVDHLIVTSSGYFSFLKHNLFEPFQDDFQNIKDSF